MLVHHKTSQDELQCEYVPNGSPLYLHGHSRWLPCLYNRNFSHFSNFTKQSEDGSIYYDEVQDSYQLHRVEVPKVERMLKRRNVYAYLGTKGFCKSVERYNTKVQNEATLNGC
eukprot:UN24199